MPNFWYFARQMLHYRRLLVVAFVTALLDAVMAFAGLGLMQAIIKITFGENRRTLHQVVEQQLSDDTLVSWIGDRSHLAELIPDDMFIGFAIAVLAILPLAGLGSLLRFTYQLTSITVALRTVMRIRQRAYFHMLHTPIGRAAEIGSADQLSRLMADTSALGRGFNTLMGKAVRDLFMGVVGLTWALLIDWKLSLIFLLGLPIIGVAIRKFGKVIRRAAKYTLRQYATMTGAVQETMQNPAVVRLHNAEGYERRRFNTINRRVVAQEMRARTARALSSPVIEYIALCGMVIVSLVAAYYVFRAPAESSVQPLDVLLVLIALGMAAMSVKPLSNLNNDLQESGAAATRIREIIDAPVEANTRRLPPQDVRPALPRHRESLAFEDVGYRYPGSDEWAVDGVDLHVGFGQSVAIVGTNGSGKSTLLNLLPRLTTPTRGRVTIDGTDIAGVSLRSLRKQIALVTQQSVLFAGTIADNIAYGRRDTPRARIVAAAEAAFADEFVRELPEGYDTVLGEAGSGLSGGQRQRLCIARAILRDPAILILDEATSQIDAESEARITAAINEARAGRTTLLIAHRLSTVVDCDNIVVMQDGRIVDQGTHRQLLERCGVYQTLVKTQLTG
jgi:ABC-type multidrug transport system fused ATPase/permease subunit